MGLGADIKELGDAPASLRSRATRDKCPEELGAAKAALRKDAVSVLRHQRPSANAKHSIVVSREVPATGRDRQQSCGWGGRSVRLSDNPACSSPDREVRVVGVTPVRWPALKTITVNPRPERRWMNSA